MSAFDRLHPAVQHHVVNSLGWRCLRPLQEAAIGPVLAGSHALLLAPTAGGKTEAAILPVFSRMLAEDWRGLSVVYVCPIKALLNNLAERLERYAGLLGRRVAVWHGDIPHGQRSRIAREPPDLLLATPESLEVVLVSRRVDHRTLFQHLRVVVVDEIHAFAGDDRGWHLIALLDRLGRLSGRVPQRLGLSATVGNAEALLDWLVAGNSGARQVVAPEAAGAPDAEVEIDFVGSLPNAATVISRLHRGEKRLVFCDSRARVEALAVELRSRGVRTFVSHSSLGADERRQAEAAFAAGTDCVIVATSTLELGIDVGDLDRVIQVDAPGTVAGFLQRLGRTGRRPGTRRNCLFLATSDDALLRALAIVRLWSRGYVEPIEPPPLPYHVLAQQVLALSLQEGGIGRAAWGDWLPGFLLQTGNSAEATEALVTHMLAQEILFEDGGVLSVGREGEARYGLRNFLEIFSVFNSPPLFTVLHGRAEVGQVHQLTFQSRGPAPIVLALGGRQWSVKHVDWGRRLAYVEPTALEGRARWLGATRPLHYALCQAMLAVLANDTRDEALSRRGREALVRIRDDFPWAEQTTTAVVADERRATWWSFGGRLLNTAIASRLAASGIDVEHDDLAVWTRGPGRAGVFPEALVSVLTEPGAARTASVAPEAKALLKFSDCVPAELLMFSLAARSDSSQAWEQVSRKRIRIVRAVAHQG